MYVLQFFFIMYYIYVHEEAVRFCLKIGLLVGLFRVAFLYLLLPKRDTINDSGYISS